ARLPGPGPVLSCVRTAAQGARPCVGPCRRVCDGPRDARCPGPRDGTLRLRRGRDENLADRDPRGPSPRPLRRSRSVRLGASGRETRRRSSMTFRGFIAVDIPPSPPLESFAEEVRSASASLKVVSTDQVHLTVKFLGDTEEGLVPEIVATIREACAGVQPFPITVRGTGAFPSL